MSITYTYEIISVDEQARCMEIVYSAEGHQTMHIGARLPFEGESVESVVEAFSPVRYWEEKQLGVVVPVVGTKGEVIPSPVLATVDPVIVDTVFDVGSSTVVVTNV